MKHNIEITTIEGMCLGNAILYYINESEAHPLDKKMLQRLLDKVHDTIANDLPKTEEGSK